MSSLKAFRLLARNCHKYAPMPQIAPIAPTRPIWQIRGMWLTIGGTFCFLAGRDYASEWEDRIVNIGPPWWVVKTQCPACGRTR